ncbi:MAG: carbohydrate ABC transporter permease [Firmicutes bacterium]|nr:carbohydrate ABC transporter permease [Bacillota bacterium]
MLLTKEKVNIKEILIYTVIIIFLIFNFFPVFWMIISSIKPTGLVFATPPKWIFKPTLENYQFALGGGSRGWGAGMFQFFLNSFITATIVTISNLAIGAYAGYGMARYNTGGSTLPLVFLVGKMLPPVVLLLPFFLLIKNLGLSDSLFVLIIAYTATSLPFSVWMSWSYFLDLPEEIEEAATIDGCSKLTLLTKVVIPMASPCLIAIGILIFVGCWNEFLFASTLVGLKARTLPVVSALFITDEAILWGPMTATCVLIMSVPIIITFFAQKYIISGISAGALKG